LIERGTVARPELGGACPGPRVDFASHHRRDAVFKGPLVSRVRQTYRRLLLRLLNRSFEKEIVWSSFDERLSAKLDCIAILLDE
jgi:hypothetical protein